MERELKERINELEKTLDEAKAQLEEIAKLNRGGDPDLLDHFNEAYPWVVW